MRALGWLAVVGLMMSEACGSGGAGVARPGESSPSAWWIVEFKSAVLTARRPDGSPWHQSGADQASVVIGGLLGLAAGNPMVGLALGKALADDGGDPLAPAPYIVLRVGGHAYPISPVGRTYAPAWPQPMRVDTRALHGEDLVVIQIMDAVDGSLIGQQSLSVAALFSRPTLTLTEIGPIASLDVETRPAPAPHRAQYDFVVPGQATIQALTEGRYPSWTTVPVWNGDTLTITAAGAVCPSLRSDHCFDANGAGEGRWRGYSYDDFKDAPHAALVGVFPGAKYVIGPHAEIHVEQAGQALLFVNDTDTDNNRGGFQVHVTVDPPP